MSRSLPQLLSERLERSAARWANGSSWSRVSSPNPGSSVNNYLTSVTAVSSTLAYAAGYNDYGPTLLQWDGTQWNNKTNDLPSGNAPVASGISFNGQYGWMVGFDPTKPGPGFGFEYNYPSGWSSNTPPIGSATGVDTIAYHSAWAVGFARQGPLRLKATSAYWDGSGWLEFDAEVAGPAGDQFYAVSALAKRDVWGAGVSVGGGYATLVEHFY